MLRTNRINENFFFKKKIEIRYLEVPKPKAWEDFGILNRGNFWECTAKIISL